MQPPLFRIYNVAQEYKIIEKVGRGTYGTVYKAIQLKTGELVAIKKIENKDPKAQAEGFPITALREINLLKTMDHKNIVRLKEIIMSKPQKRNCFRGSTFLVFEYMDHDFAGLFRHKIRYSPSEVKCIMLQIIEGVKYLHDSKILHRDLKSANLLMNNKGEVKIADFGLGRRFRTDYTYTSKVVTLWYRAPELLLGAKQYSEKIDMWSIGCIMAEFFIGEVLFRKDTDFLQIQQIYDICGGLDENNFTEAKAFSTYNDFKPQNILNPKRLTSTILKFYPEADEHTIDLLNKLLELNPKHRINCAEALEHPFFHQNPLPCKPSEIKRLDKEYHEMYRDPKPVEKREQFVDKKLLPKAFEQERVPQQPRKHYSQEGQDTHTTKQPIKISTKDSSNKRADHDPEARQLKDENIKRKSVQKGHRDYHDSRRYHEQPEYRERDRQNDKQRRQPNSKPRDYYDEKGKGNDRVPPHERNTRYDAEREGPARSRSRSRDNQKQRIRQRERLRQRQRERQRQRDRVRYQDRDRIRDRSKDKSHSDRSLSKQKKYPSKYYENGRAPEKTAERSSRVYPLEYRNESENTANKYEPRDKQRGRHGERRDNQYREREGSPRDRSRSRERIRNRDYRQRERERDRQKSKERQRERGRERERSKDRERSREKDRDRDRDRERQQRQRQRQRERQRQRSRDRVRDRGRDHDKEKNGDRQSSRTQERLLPMTKEAYQKQDAKYQDEGRYRDSKPSRDTRNPYKDNYANDYPEKSNREKGDYKQLPPPPPPRTDSRRF